jgi:hypothetical protein
MDVEELKESLIKLRKAGCSRADLKNIVDEICNNVKKG